MVGEEVPLDLTQSLPARPRRQRLWNTASIKPIVVDVGGGYGGAVTLRLKDNDIKPMAFNGANESLAQTRDGQLKFANRRAEAWWRFREALDPDQPDGSAIALPPDPDLRADLSTPTWKLTARGILLESKEEIRKRLGRLPGKGDAVVMAWSEGNKAAMARAQKKPSPQREPFYSMHPQAWMG